MGCSGLLEQDEGKIAPVPCLSPVVNEGGKQSGGLSGAGGVGHSDVECDATDGESGQWGDPAVVKICGARRCEFERFGGRFARGICWGSFTGFSHLGEVVVPHIGFAVFEFA